MDLQSFVQKTSIQIINGVRDAENEINPRHNGRFFGLGAPNKEDNGVYFEVAVTVVEENEKNKEGRALIKVVGGSMSKHKKRQNGTIKYYQI